MGKPLLPCAAAFILSVDSMSWQGSKRMKSPSCKIHTHVFWSCIKQNFKLIYMLKSFVSHANTCLTRGSRFTKCLSVSPPAKVSSGPCKQNRAESSLSSSSLTCFYRYAGFPDSVVLAKCKTGRGWASVLKTQLSNGRRSSLEKSRYKYLDTKTKMKNISIKAWTGRGNRAVPGPTVQQLQL